MKQGLQINEQGNRYWYKDDKLHREDGPAVECVDGLKVWFINGLRHREDGPAHINRTGTRRWYLNDKLHREDGPSVETSYGEKEWFLCGRELSKKEWTIKMRRKKLIELLIDT